LTVFRWAGDFFAGFLDDFVAVFAFTAAFFFFVAYLQSRAVKTAERATRFSYRLRCQRKPSVGLKCAGKLSNDSRVIVWLIIEHIFR
jgi:hypothetical protein